MIIEKVTTQNFCQHRERKEELGEGLIGVVGRNGDGKSNFVRSVLFGLSGDSGNAGNKADDITRGEKGGSVRCDFLVGGKKGFVKRDLKTSRAHLKFDGEEYKSAKEVDKAIFSILGVNAKILREVVFVGQGQIERMLFDKPAERKKAFSALFGTDHLERLRDLLQNELTGVQAVSQAHAIAQAENELASLSEQYAQLEAAANKVKASLLGAEDHARYKETMEHFIAYTNKTEETKKAEQELEQAVTLHKSEAEKYTAWNARLDASAETLKALKGAYAEAKARVDSGTKAAQDNMRRTGLKTTLDRCVAILQASPTPAWEGEAELKSCEETVERMRDDIASARKVVASLDAGTKACPTCGQKVDDGFVESMQSYLATHNPQYQQAQTRVSELLSEKQERENTLRDEALARIEADASMKAAREELDRLGEEPAVLSTADDKVLVEEYERTDEAYCEEATRLATFRGRVEQLAVYVRNAGEKVQQLRTEIPEKITYETQDTARRLIDAHHQAEINQAELSGQLTSLRDRMIAVKERLDRLKGEEATIEKRLKWRTLCEDARMILHHDRLPNRIAQAYLGALNTKMAQYLEVFQARYGCAIQSDLSIQCMFGEHALPAERLSGGQKVELGLAFRFALYDLFVSSVGLLVIDEPTAYLDDDHIDAVGRALERVKAHSRARGMQVVVPTHEERLMPVFDRVIRI